MPNDDAAPPKSAASTRGNPTVTQSLQEYARGVAGGLIFSLPLLFTMEMWWAGMVLNAPRLILYVIATFILLLGYNQYVGLHQKTSPLEIWVDSVEEMGIGLVIAAAMLFLLGRISTQMPPGEMLGILIIESMTVAIGVSVGTAQLGTPDDNSKAEDEKKDEQSTTLGGEIVIAACGAMLFASNVAPTEEIVKLAAEMSSPRLLILALLSFFLGAMILYFSDFRGAKRFFSGRYRRRHFRRRGAQLRDWFARVGGDAVVFRSLRRHGRLFHAGANRRAGLAGRARRFRRTIAFANAIIPLTCER